MQGSLSTGVLRPPRGECPSVHQPFREVDGSLVRVRVPGGILSADQVRQVAEVARCGTAVELTNRANLQIRGVGDADLGSVVRALVGAGVTAADPVADGRRNVLADPTAGHAVDEVLDTRPLVADVVDRLLRGPAGSLSPKFGVVIDGGGGVHVRGRRHDLCFGAIRDHRGEARMEVRLGSALPMERDRAPVALLRPAEIGEFLSAALEVLATHGGEPGRMAVLAEEEGETETIASLARRAGLELEMVDADALAPLPGASVRPIGVLADRVRGHAMVGGMPILGRLTPAALEGIAAVADAAGGGMIRLTPWRSVLLTGVTLGRVEPVLGDLERLGLIIDPADPATDVVACAGSRGCPSGLTDTQEDGRELVSLLRSSGLVAGRAVHVSGCAKRCAAGDQEFAATLEGGSHAGAYVVIRHAESGPLAETTGRSGTADALSTADALQSVVALLSGISG